MASLGIRQGVFAAILALCAVSVSAENTPQQPSLMDTFPSAREFYYPLIADPTELGYSGRYLYQVGGGHYAEITVGDYLGLLRWQLPSDWIIQLNIAGGVLARFDMNTIRNALEVTDFTAGLPLDFHHGDSTVRMGIWHTSSHLGDDFLKVNDVVIQKRSDDMLKVIYSYSPTKWLRLYSGGSYAFHVIVLFAITGGVIIVFYC